MTIPMGNNRINTHPCTDAEEASNLVIIEETFNTFETRIEVIEAGSLEDNYTVRVNAAEVTPAFLENQFENAGGTYVPAEDRLVHFETVGDDVLRAFVNVEGLGGGEGDIITDGLYIAITDGPPREISVDVEQIDNWSGSGVLLLGLNAGVFKFDPVGTWIDAGFSGSRSAGIVQVVGHTVGGPTEFINAAELASGIDVDDGRGIDVTGTNPKAINLVVTGFDDTHRQDYGHNSGTFAHLDRDAFYVRNASGGDRGVGDITALTGAALPNYAGVSGAYPTINSEAPVAGDPFAIWIDTADMDVIARARSVGVCVATVDIDDVSHEFAKAIDGDYDKLISTTSGYARILSKSGGGEGQRVCTLLLGVAASVGTFICQPLLEIDAGTFAAMEEGAATVKSVGDAGALTTVGNRTVFNPFACAIPTEGSYPCAKTFSAPDEADDEYTIIGLDILYVLKALTGFAANKSLAVEDGGNDVEDIKWLGVTCASE